MYVETDGESYQQEISEALEESFAIALGDKAPVKFKTYIHGGDFRICSAEISYIKIDDEIQNEEIYEVLISLQNTIATNKLNKVSIRIENLNG